MKPTGSTSRRSIADLSELHTRKGDLARAVAAHDEALRVLRGHVNEEDLQLMAVRNGLADLYRTAGEFDKAEPLLTESRSITGKVAKVAVETVQKDEPRPMPRPQDATDYFNSPERAIRQGMGIKGGNPFGTRPSRGAMYGGAMAPQMNLPGSVSGVLGRSHQMPGLNSFGAGPLGSYAPARRNPMGMMGGLPGSYGGSSVVGHSFSIPQAPSAFAQSLDPFGRMGAPGGSDSYMERHRERLYGNLPPDVRRMVDPHYRVEGKDEDDPMSGPGARGFDPARGMGLPAAPTADRVMAELKNQLYGDLLLNTRRWMDPEGYARELLRTQRSRSATNPWGNPLLANPASTRVYIQRTLQKVVKLPPLAAFLAHLSNINRMTELYLAKGDQAAADRALADGQGFLSLLKLEGAGLPAVRVFWFNQGRSHATQGRCEEGARAVRPGPRPE